MKKYLILIFIAVVLVVIGLGASSQRKAGDGTVVKSTTTVSTSTQQEQTSSKTLQIANNVVDVLPATDSLGGVTTYLTLSGKIQSASLFSYSFVNGESIGEDNVYDNTFISIGNNKTERGGHFRGSFLDLSNAKIFQLGGSQESVNFVDIMNTAGSTIRVDLFVSSAQGNRNIKTAFINYTCDGDCLLEVKK